MTYKNTTRISEEITVTGNRLLLLSGPCAIESKSLCEEVAGYMKELCLELEIDFVFKASFDKANRTASESYRGEGMEKGLSILQSIKDDFSVPVVTDIHLPSQAELVGKVADVLQIPAFLCRQSDLLYAAGTYGKSVNIKKGQFMSPEDMQYAVEKVQSAGNNNVLLTERGTTFGYNNLVVDMRSLPVMRQFAPVIFDVTHSVQMPGAAGGKSGGRREFAPYLAKAAAGAGVDGFFIETHPEPDKALSDGPNMIPLSNMRSLLEQLLHIHHIVYEK